MTATQVPSFDELIARLPTAKVLDKLDPRRSEEALDTMRRDLVAVFEDAAATGVCPDRRLIKELVGTDASKTNPLSELFYYNSRRGDHLNDLNLNSTLRAMDAAVIALARRFSDDPSGILLLSRWAALGCSNPSVEVPLLSEFLSRVAKGMIAVDPDELHSTLDGVTAFMRKHPVTGSGPRQLVRDMINQTLWAPALQLWTAERWRHDELVVKRVADMIQNIMLSVTNKERDVRIGDVIAAVRSLPLTTVGAPLMASACQTVLLNTHSMAGERAPAAIGMLRDWWRIDDHPKAIRALIHPSKVCKGMVDFLSSMRERSGGEHPADEQVAIALMTDIADMTRDIGVDEKLAQTIAETMVSAANLACARCEVDADLNHLRSTRILYYVMHVTLRARRKYEVSQAHRVLRSLFDDRSDDFFDSNSDVDSD